MTISKSDLRRLVRKLESAETPEKLRGSGEVLISRFLASPEYDKANVLFLYCGVGTEPDTRPIIADALSRGKRVALPAITGPGIMEAREIRSSGQLVPGRFGIPEPDIACPIILPEELELILVPGAAFSPDGGRLGRGGGYYDRYLPRTRCVKIALVRALQLFDSIPTDTHDIPVDVIITDEG